MEMLGLHTTTHECKYKRVVECKYENLDYSHYFNLQKNAKNGKKNNKSWSGNEC